VVKLPPLRERTDLDMVIDKLLASESENRPCRVSDEVMRMFRQHKWPGNFRQLTNLLRTAIVMLGDDAEILPEHLPDDFLDDIQHARRQDISDTVERVVFEMSRLEDVETSVIRKSLEAHGGNVSATARALGVSRNTIYRKIQQ
jgi:transcriptional regulator of acetoin/glycerol metabolism